MERLKGDLAVMSITSYSGVVGNSTAKKTEVK